MSLRNILLIYTLAIVAGLLLGAGFAALTITLS